jgi:hypothetical protein
LLPFTYPDELLFLGCSNILLRDIRLLELVEVDAGGLLSPFWEEAVLGMKLFFLAL